MSDIQDSSAGVIDFGSGDADLVIAKVAELLDANEEADFYCDIDGQHYAFNAIFEKHEYGEQLEVMFSQIIPKKKGQELPDLLGVFVIRYDPENPGHPLYSPFIDDDDKLSLKAKRLQLSVERELGIDRENDIPCDNR